MTSSQFDRCKSVFTIFVSINDFWVDLSLIPATSQSDIFGSYEVASDMAACWMYDVLATIYELEHTVWSCDLFIQPPPRRSKTFVPTDVQYVSQGSYLVSFYITSVDTCTHCVPIYFFFTFPT